MNPDLINIAAVLKEISSTLQDMQADLANIADEVKASKDEAARTDG